MAKSLAQRKGQNDASEDRKENGKDNLLRVNADLEANN